VTIELFNLLGGRVATLSDGEQVPGSEKPLVIDVQERHLAPGTYIYHMLVDGQPLDSKKMVVGR
jgi:hypothetical protein